jgi:nucleoside-diphosphate-sugar epimerase
VAQVGGHSAIPILPYEERAEAQHAVFGDAVPIDLTFADVTDQEAMFDLFRRFRPNAAVHLGEMPSAPYSMASWRHQRETYQNNVIGTLSLINAIYHSALECHLVKLGCYDEKTEILTDKGWKPFADLGTTDNVCCLNSETEEIEYHAPSRYVRYQYAGKMWRAQTKSTSECVTPDHRVVVREDGGIRVILASSIGPDDQIVIPRGGRWTVGDVDKFYIPGGMFRGPGGRMFRRDSVAVDMDKWLEFFGLWISEGTIRRRNGASVVVRICVKKEQTVSATKAAIEGIGLRYSERVKADGCHEIDINDVQLGTYLDTFGLQPFRRIPREILTCSARQLEILYKSMMEGDGHVNTSGTEYYYSSSAGLLDDVQELVLKIGRVGRVCAYHREDRGTTEYYLSIGKRNVDTAVYPEKHGWIDYKGNVYCCTVPTGIVLTRRNGRVAWSGNSMGVYGTPSIPIREGWVDLTLDGKTDRVLMPHRPGSWYHVTKSNDSHNVEFACRMWKLAATDIHQGVVYGTRTADLVASDRLSTRFDYDGQFGTAINRFVAQAVCGLPITPYGRGQQRRGFIPLADSIQCLTIAIENPASNGEYRVFNQLEEVYQIDALASLVREVAAERGLDARIEHLDNPRVEAEVHSYEPAHEKLRELGYRPSTNMRQQIAEMITDLLPYRDRMCRTAATVLPAVKWR